MKYLAKILSVIMLLAVPLCVAAEEPSDTSVTHPLYADEEYVSVITASAAGPELSASIVHAVPEEEPPCGDLDVDDEILMDALLEERMKDQGTAADGEEVLLAEAEGLREEPATEDDDGAEGEYNNEDLENNRIADPLYYWNVSMYHFNDKFYFWLLKPVAQGYSAIAPEPVRIAVSNFFQNLTTPIRFVANLLQLKLKNAGDELVRFVTNSTQGLAGFMDVAKSHYGIATHDEDIGQALGSYGIGHGFYLVWPFLGPSSLRDTAGLVGDTLLNPVTYVNPLETSIGIRAYDRVNETTFHIGDYEDMKEAAIDPYVSLRNGYVQHRKKQVKE